MDYDEEVFVIIDGKPTFVKICKLYDLWIGSKGKLKVHAFSFNEDLKVE